MCAGAVLETATPRDEAREATSAKVLAGKRALVTGGSRGIGKAIALALAEAGAAVAINYNARSKQPTRSAGPFASSAFRAISFRPTSCEEEAKAMIEAVSKEFGEIDILVNNAGITRDKSFLKMTKSMWDEVLGVNLNGVFSVTRLVLPAMVEAAWGGVINMTSIVGQTGNFGQANYAVTKGGLIAFTMTLAREVARKGVTVNAIAPGFIETDMTKDMTPAALSAVTAMTPSAGWENRKKSQRRCSSSPRPKPAISPARSSP